MVGAGVLLAALCVLGGVSQTEEAYTCSEVSPRGDGRRWDLCQPRLGEEAALVGPLKKGTKANEEAPTTATQLGDSKSVLAHVEKAAKAVKASSGRKKGWLLTKKGLSPGCYYKLSSCPGHPAVVASHWKRDSYGEKEKGAATHFDKCEIGRKKAFEAMCGAGTVKMKFVHPACVQHIGISGDSQKRGWPQFNGLKLADGSSASAEWYKPYMKHHLPKGLRGCNPASCDNKPSCGIPVCKGAYFCQRPTFIKQCPSNCGHDGAQSCLSVGIREHLCGGQGCTLTKNLIQVNNTVPYLPKGPPKDTAFQMTVPGRREGFFRGFGYPPGYAQTYPVAGYYADVGFSGYLTPSERYCNPMKFEATSKWSITHTGASGQPHHRHEKAALIFVKSTLCMKAKCKAGDKSCPPKKCYAAKSGRCIQFHKRVFYHPTRNPFGEMYKMNYHDVVDAWKEYRARRYTDCHPVLAAAAAQYLAGV